MTRQEQIEEMERLGFRKYSIRIAALNDVLNQFNDLEITPLSTQAAIMYDAGQRNAVGVIRNHILKLFERQELGDDNGEAE